MAVELRLLNFELYNEIKSIIHFIGDIVGYKNIFRTDANGQQPTAKSSGFYAKASANIAYPIPRIIGSIGYEFNKHFAIGIGGGVISGCLL